MHEFERFGVFLVEVDACDATVVYLSEKLAHVRPAFVPNPCFGKQAASASGLEDTDGEIDIFAEAHLGKTVELQVDIPADAHVEGAGIELVQFLLATPDASGGEEAGHGVADGLLCVGKRVVCPVGTAESVSRFALQFLFDGGEIAFGHHHVRVQHDKIFTPGPFCAVVAAHAGSGVGFHEILQVQLPLIFFADIGAGHLRTVFYNNHFEVFHLLMAEAFQQLVHLVGTVEYGDND